MLKSQILQLGCPTREQIDKVDLVTVSQVSKDPEIEAPTENNQKRARKKRC